MNQSLVAEFQHESDNSRRMLERVPDEHFSWKPHEKSYSLHHLAMHIAQMAGWAKVTIEQDELDFSKQEFEWPEVNSTRQLMELFEKHREEAIASLQQVTDEELMKPWTLRNGPQVFFTMPKIVVLRSMVFNHIIHHRGQLSVYLRLLNVPLPGIYGPSADEQ